MKDQNLYPVVLQHSLFSSCLAFAEGQLCFWHEMTVLSLSPHYPHLEVFEVAIQVLTVNGADLRDPSTTPLNFTKSINLALSERGIHSMKLANANGLLKDVLDETIPMYARMIHGRRKGGDFYQESQQYDAHGRVSCPLGRPKAD